MPIVKRKHFLLASIPGFGHIIPLLELGKKISNYHQVTFAVSQWRVNEIKKRELLSAEYEQKIGLLGWDDGTEALMNAFGIPPAERLVMMMDLMKQPLQHLLENLPNLNVTPQEKARNTALTVPIDVVIIDRFLTSTVTPLCHNLGIPCYIFNCSAGFETPAVPTVEHGALDIDDGEKRFRISISETLDQAKGFILNTFYELDGEAVKSELSGYPRLANIPVWFLGPLFAQENDKDSQLLQQVKKWLDEQEERSVVYVSFGSIADLADSQIPVLFDALITLGKPFIWSLPEKGHSQLPGNIRSSIAQQFSGNNQKFLILPWAPQKTILAHRATKVFVTHCGWNSTLESITCGVPMVGWPLFGDQHLNGKWMESLDIALVIPETRIYNSRIVPAHDIQSVIAAVGGWNGADQTDSFFEKIQKLAKCATEALMENGTSTRDFQNMIKQ